MAKERNYYSIGRLCRILPFEMVLSGMVNRQLTKRVRGLFTKLMTFLYVDRAPQVSFPVMDLVGWDGRLWQVHCMQWAQSLTPHARTFSAQEYCLSSVAPPTLKSTLWIHRVISSRHMSKRANLRCYR